MDLQLKNKRAFLAAASRGLGYATALLLATEGCRVAINGRDEARVNAAAEKISKESGGDAGWLASGGRDSSHPGKIIETTNIGPCGVALPVCHTGGAASLAL